MQSATRRLLTVLVIAGLILIACGGGGSTSEDGAMVTDSGFTCPQPSTPAEVTSDELNLFVWTEYIPQDIIDCFEMVYDVKVNRDEFSSNEEMYAKLKAGGSSYDLTQPTDQLVSLMIRQNMLQKLDKSKLPVMGNFDSAYLNLPFDPNNDYTLPYQAGMDALVINTDVVENKPQSFADLWKPEYAGRMILLDDARTIIGITLLTLGYDVNTQDPAQLEEARRKLAQLTPGVKIFDSDSPKTALIAGDADLGVTWTGEARLAQQENPAIEFIYPSEGAIRWQDNWAIPANAPHADAAYAWLNYTLQPELFWMMLRDFPYNNPNKAAIEFAKTNHPELYDSYMASNITNPPADALANAHRLDDVGAATPLYDEVWTEVKGQ